MKKKSGASKHKDTGERAMTARVLADQSDPSTARLASTVGDAGILQVTGKTAAVREAAKMLHTAVEFSRMARQLAATCDGPKGAIQPRKLVTQHPINFVLQALADVITTGTERDFAEALVIVYKRRMDQADAHPELEHLPFAYADARSSADGNPRVSDVQNCLRARGIKIDEDTLRLRLTAHGYPLREPGKH